MTANMLSLIACANVLSSTALCRLRLDHQPDAAERRVFLVVFLSACAGIVAMLILLLILVLGAAH